MALKLTDGVRVLSGVGEVKAKALEKLGLHSLSDLLEWYPRDYEDRRRIYTLRDAPEDVPVCVTAVIARPCTTSFIRKGMDITRTVAFDDTGSVSLTFFNQPFLRTALKVGESYTFYGRVERAGGKKSMTNPVFEQEGAGRITGRITPIYPRTAGVTSKQLAGWIHRVAEECLAQVEEDLPDSLLCREELMEKRQALACIHAPRDFDELERARERLIFQELFTLTVGLERLRCRRRGVTGCICRPQPLEEYYDLLPFAPTQAQRRTLEEIMADLTGGGAMNRLIQGDVGSGKTAVAAGGIWLAARSGWQSAYMAPTEILARQHFETLSSLLAPAGVETVLLTGSLKATQRRDVLAQIARGDARLVVGTHAILSQGVEFDRLGLAITDEQHRFGVEQRAILAAKGGEKPPHVLVMSATPIPRTLALMVYGDLDVSVLDQLPPGRREVETYLVGSDKRRRMYNFIRGQVQQGRQAFIVCPAVEENEENGLDMKSVLAYEQQLREEVFPDLRIGLIHGKLKGTEKDRVMASFAAGELDVLVATTVIEVGVDVPNATLMVVENAERFGLSQLHQLRGRVGRGAHQSYCILVTDHRDPATRERLKTLTETADGFRIAEEDLKLRGPGDFFGSRQHGLPQLRVADLAGDTRILYRAQNAARELLAEDPELEREENRPVHRMVLGLFRDNPDIFN